MHAETPDADRMKNRRLMAWVALISMLVVTMLACFVIDPIRLGIIKELLSWFFSVMTGIVINYMCSASFENVKMGGGPTPPQRPDPDLRNGEEHI